MPERPRGRDPNSRKEHREQLPEYRMAARFPDEPTSNTAYETTRDIIHTDLCDLSLYRTALMPAMDWYVLVLGQQPPEPLRERIDQAMSTGVAVELPEDVWRAFNARRLEQSEWPVGGAQIPTSARALSLIVRNFNQLARGNLEKVAQSFK